MKSGKYLVLALLLFFFNCEIRAQNNIDSLRKENLHRKVPIASLLGVWYSDDTLGSKIEFVIKDYEVILEPYMVGVSNYIFLMEKDSVSVSGFAPNWPPYDCILKLHDLNTLELFFFQYHSVEPYCVIYKRD